MELVIQAMCKGKRMIDSRELINQGLKGIIAEVQVAEFTGRRVEHAKNIPTSLLAGVSGKSSNSSTLYLFPLTMCVSTSFTWLLMKLQGWPTTSQLVKSHLTGITCALLGKMAQYSPPYSVTARKMVKVATETKHNNLFKLSPSQ